MKQHDVTDLSLAHKGKHVQQIDLAVAVHPVPEHIEKEVAKLKLDAMGILIDSLTIK